MSAPPPLDPGSPRPLRGSRARAPLPALRRALAGAALCLALAGLPAAESPGPAPDEFLFSFFRDNGQDGLFLAASRDGRVWSELKPPGKSFLASTLGNGLMRDPCLRRAPDGVFHLVWTTGWGDRIIGYARSKDLLHWSDPKAIRVMTQEPTTRNVWAPELFYEEETGRWLIFWSSTVPGRFPETAAAGDDGWNHRAYYVTTRDFETVSDTKLLYDGGFNVIDATLIRSGPRYYLIVKDETLKPVRKHLRFAVGDHAEGPYGPASEPFTLSWVEGPSAVNLDGQVVVYFDHYTSPQYYGAVQTSDFKTWQDITPQLSFPAGARHGTVLRVPASVLKPLR
jgi:hypothetical protein